LFASLLLLDLLKLVMMKDAGRDASAGQREHDQNNIPQHVKDLEIEFGSRAPSFTTVHKDFGIDNQDVTGLHADRISPGRRRILLLACVCILGKGLLPDSC
jgi:hypothetical protein